MTFKAWITKYALTKGIQEVEAKVCDGSDTMVRYGRHEYAHGEGLEWHRSLESAQKRANLMRQNKIASMEKSIAKLRAKVF